MKKIFSLLLIAATVLSTTSCTKDTIDIDYPNLYLYVTVMEDNNDGGDIYMKMDNGQTFVVVNNRSADYSNLEVGDRVITGVTLSASSDENYDFMADLYEIISVIEGESRVVTTPEESDEIADNSFSYIVADAILSYGYLNLLTGFSTGDISSVRFYLVENSIETTSDDSYLNLELRFDRAKESNSTIVYERAISFDMESYREKLEGKKGINLRIKTLKSGEVDMKIDSKELYPED